MSFAIRRAPGWKTLAPWIAAAVLGTGWLAREAAHAAARVEKLASTTVNLGDVAMKEFTYEGKPVGQVGVYVQGDTPASTKFVTGRFVLQPGQTPHAPHVHVEEEVMVIEKGTGEIFCDGKTTRLAPIADKHDPGITPHGIVNTGKEPIVFIISGLPKGLYQTPTMNSAEHPESEDDSWFPNDYIPGRGIRLRRSGNLARVTKADER